MKPGRIGYWLVVFAAVLLAGNAGASEPASTAQRTVQGHASTRDLDDGAERAPCVESPNAANCLGHCMRSDNSDGQTLSLGVPAVPVAPPVMLHRVWLPRGPEPIVVASEEPVVGPRLTILFHNLRN